MERTKLKKIESTLIATNGLIDSVNTLTHSCEEDLGEDYGLHQVLALLRMTRDDLMVQIYLMDGKPNRP